MIPSPLIVCTRTQNARAMIRKTIINSMAKAVEVMGVLFEVSIMFLWL